MSTRRYCGLFGIRNLALVAIVLNVAACDMAQMPPCSALVVIGSVTFSCPGDAKR